MTGYPELKKQPRSLRMLRRLSKNWKALIFLLGLFGILALSSGCASIGPRVEICIVDEAMRGFQCSSEEDHHSFKTLSEGKELLCFEPFDMEQFLKSCQKGITLSITSCVVVLPDSFLCEPPPHGGVTYPQTLKETENYVCLNGKDYKRMLERCHS